jgi:transcriptional regulator with XRE-family HTH domain
MLVAMNRHSQIANICASPYFRNPHNASQPAMSQTADMDDSKDKNGGPNHLRAWMEYRNVKGVELAERLGGNVTPGMVSDLANSNRALSAKWLRRLADALETTPGLLLDHDPREMDADLLDIWLNANVRERKQISDIAKALVGTGTDG